MMTLCFAGSLSTSSGGHCHLYALSKATVTPATQNLMLSQHTFWAAGALVLVTD